MHDRMVHCMAGRAGRGHVSRAARVVYAACRSGQRGRRPRAAPRRHILVINNRAAQRSTIDQAKAIAAARAYSPPKTLHPPTPYSQHSASKRNEESAVRIVLAPIG